MNALEKELEEKMAQAKSEEEVIQIFADAGIQVTIDQLNAVQTQEDGELNEEALAAVSGGSVWSIVNRLLNRYYASRYNAGGGGYAAGGGGKGAFGGGGIGSR